MVTQWHNEVWKTHLTTDAQFRVAEVILETVNTKAAYMLRHRDRADFKKNKNKNKGSVSCPLCCLSKSVILLHDLNFIVHCIFVF